jgi:hypothetical protein
LKLWELKNHGFQDLTPWESKNLRFWVFETFGIQELAVPVISKDSKGTGGFHERTDKKELQSGFLGSFFSSLSLKKENHGYKSDWGI